MNKVILIGNVGKEPEIKTFSNGDRIAQCSLATTERWKDKNGEKQERTEWHSLKFKGALVDIFEKYVSKGDKLAILGKLVYRKVENNGSTTYYTDVVVDEMQMLTPKSEKQPEAKQEAKRAEYTPPSQQSDYDDDLPFG